MRTLPSGAENGSGRPSVAIPGRFAASAAGLRYRAVVVAERLAEAVFAAGGEPLVLLPGDPAETGRRLRFAQALLLPGGGDLSPASYNEAIGHPDVYGLDERQDSFDLSACRFALAQGLPLLAICRGMQVLNVACGGSLHQHLEPPHRQLVHSVRVEPGSRLAVALDAPTASVSCFHHQGVARIGAGLVPVAFAADGVIEALEPGGSVVGSSWALGVQWHPEDTWDSDARQLSLFKHLVGRSARWRMRRVSGAPRTTPRRPAEGWP